MKHRLVCSVALALVVGAGYVQSQAPAKPQAPAFDGNVANIVWGGRVESITGFQPHPGAMRNLISEVSMSTHIPGTPGPKDVVVSFFKRESALVGSVTVIGMPRPMEPRTSRSGPHRRTLRPGDYKVVVKAGREGRRRAARESDARPVDDRAPRDEERATGAGVEGIDGAATQRQTED